MAMQRFILSVLFILLAFPFQLSSTSQGVRIHLTHIDSDGNFTKIELLRRSLERDSRRASGRLLPSSNVGRSFVRAPVHAGEGEFLMDLAIGTPNLRFPAIMDTGSDLTWTQCQPCMDCYKQPTSVFDPSSSSSFSNVPCSSSLCEALPSFDCEREGECSYTYSYGDKSITKGVLGTETFTFDTSDDSISFSSVGFGCGEANSGVGFRQASGVVGLGRGPLSLVSQLKMGKFSYCLTKFGQRKQSTLLLGSLESFNGAAGNHTTPLVKNPSHPSFYYLILLGVSVGGKTLPIPDSTFALNADGTGGVIVDSGTSITYLEGLAYDEVKKAFLSRVKLPIVDVSNVGLDLCFQTVAGKQLKLPNMVFHFDGLDVDLPPENYLIKDDHTGLLCLAMTRSSGMSIFGNFQQQNFHVLYDLENEMLSFVPARCDQI